MAFVRKDRLSPGTRIAKGIAGAIQGGFDGYTAMKNIQVQQEKLAQERQQLAGQQQMQQQQMFMMASDKQSKIMAGALVSPDPEAAMQSNRESWERWQQFGAIKTGFDDAVMRVKSYAPIVGDQQKLYNAQYAMIQDPGVPFEKKQLAYQQAANALQTMRGSITNSDFLEHVGTQKTNLDQAMGQASAQEAKSQQIETAVKNRPSPEAAQSIKSDKDADKMVFDTIQTVQGLKRTGQTGPLQMANKRVSLAGDGLRLISQLEKGDVKSTKSVETELARNIDGLVTAGAQGSSELVKEMINKTIYSKYAGVEEWLKSSPQNHIPTSFLSNYKHQIEGQQGYWKDEQTKNIQGQEEALQGAFEGDKGAKRKERFLKAVKRFAPNYVGIDEQPGAAQGAAAKSVVKKGYNAKTDQTQLIYSDGSKEIVSGRQ